MKVKTRMFFAVLIFILPVSSLAQGLSGETELGTDGKEGTFFSQYVFYDFEKSNILTRYFWVNNILNRGELAYGPTFNFNDDNVLKLVFGGTTDRNVMIAGTFLTKIKGHVIFHIVDGKISTTDNPNTLYQKLFCGINKSGTFQFRIEDLQVGNKQDFLRIGIEYQYRLPNDSLLFLAPFYDPINKAFGGQVGYRFF